MLWPGKAALETLFQKILATRPNKNIIMTAAPTRQANAETGRSTISKSPKPCTRPNGPDSARQRRGQTKALLPAWGHIVAGRPDAQCIKLTYICRLYTVQSPRTACKFGVKMIKKKNNNHRHRRSSLRYQVVCALKKKFKQGRSKYQDKRRNHGKPYKNVIYSASTLRTYIRVGCTFASWCQSVYGCRYLWSCRPHAGEWLRIKQNEGLSPATIKKYGCALGKLFHCGMHAFAVTYASCTRANSVKNRLMGYIGDTTAHHNAWNLSMASGARRHEQNRVVLDNMVLRGDRWWLVALEGKGGRVRDVPLLPQYTAIISEMIVSARGNGCSHLLPERVPADLHTHYFRAMYAVNLYSSFARPIEIIPKKERYYCRAELRGLVLDRLAMREVSHALGHNRLGVVTTYLWPLAPQANKCNNEMLSQKGQHLVVFVYLMMINSCIIHQTRFTNLH